MTSTLPILSLMTIVALGACAADDEPLSPSGPFVELSGILQPGAVNDLTIAAVSDSSVDLEFTEVDDGTGEPASYDIRVAIAPLSWGSGTDVSQGTCQVPAPGTAIGARRRCSVLGLAPATEYEFQLVAFRGTLNEDAVFGALSNVIGGMTDARAPGTVTDLAVSEVTDTSVVLAFTEVDDGTGRPASYFIRYAAAPLAWGSATDVSRGSCQVPVAGVVIGDLRRCEILGLRAGTSYEFQLVAFRGTLNVDAQFGGLSNTVAISTSVDTMPADTAPPDSTPGTAGIVFESDWSTATGTSPTAVRDGTRWDNYWEFNNGTGVQLLSVVAGAGPAGRNALQVIQRGETYAANIQEDNVVPLSTDYYVRFYMRNDDPSPSGDHIVTVDTWGYANLTFMRRYSGSTGWRFVMSLYGCGFTYPIAHWGPSIHLALGEWYRFEYHIDFLNPTHVQVHARVYDATGALILDDDDFRQEDHGSAVWNGRSDWTLASYYAAGHGFCVQPSAMTSFGMGNNGQLGAQSTGAAWFFAGVQIRTDGWPGP